MRQIKINMNDTMYKELQELSKRDNRSIESIFRIGLGLRAHYEDERQAGNRLMIFDANGTAIKELVL